MSGAIARNRQDVVEHSVQARRTIATAYEKAVVKIGTPGIPKKTGRLGLSYRTNFDGRGSWPLGRTWKHFSNLFYAGIIAFGRIRDRLGRMIGSRQNPKGHHVTADREAQKAFLAFAWRPSR